MSLLDDARQTEIRTRRRAPAVRPMESWSRELDLRGLAQRYGSPLYLHHPATLRRNFDAYVRLVGEPGNVRYPVKANPSPLVLEALARWGAGADCASRPEVQAALAAGIPVRRVSYNTPAMDLPLAAWLLRQGGTVVADSEAGLDELEQAFDDGDGFAGHLFLRANPGGLPGYEKKSDLQRYTAHGAASSQFGIPSERIPGLLTATPLPVSGFHVHVGTMMDNLATFAAGLDFLHALVDLTLAETPHPLEAVNLGGGLGLPHLAGQEFPGIGALADHLGERLRDGLRYEVEPGNSLVGDSFALLTRVASLKESRGRRWAVVDAGTDQLVKHTVARWEHQIVDAGHRPLPQEGPDTLAGPLCFAGDVLLPATDLAAVAAGDPLLVRHAGAYCEAIASRFNGRTSPATVVVNEDGSTRLARRREDPFFEPMLQTHRPEGFERSDGGRELAGDRLAALQSEYMHRLAEDEGYEITGAREVAERTYVFDVEPRAPVGFVALPLALRIVGDACITAVGLEMGWERKRAPVWATRLTLTAGANLPADRPLPCRVAVSALHPGIKPGTAATGHVHFELGDDGEVRGVAKVSIPDS
jgi:diaminopimelate decarboxylase